VTISDLGQHAGEDFQAKVFFVPQSVRPALDDQDLGVDALHEPQGELLLGLAVRRDPAPVPVDDRGELLEGLETLPFQGFFAWSKNRLAHPSRRYPTIARTTP